MKAKQVNSLQWCIQVGSMLALFLGVGSLTVVPLASAANSTASGTTSSGTWSNSSSAPSGSSSSTKKTTTKTTTSGDTTKQSGDIWTTDKESYPYLTVVGSITTKTTTTTKTTSTGHQCTGTGGPYTTHSGSFPNGSANKAGANSACNTTTKTSTSTSTSTTVNYLMRPIPFKHEVKTTVNMPTSKAGDTVTFTHTITKLSGNPPSTANPPKLSSVKNRTGATYNYGYNQLKTFACNAEVATLKLIYGDGFRSSCYKDTRDSLLPTKTLNAYTYTTSFAIGKDTPDGAKICYGTKAYPSDEKGGTAADGTPACTTVQNIVTEHNLIPSVSLNSASPAEPGEPVNLADQVQNTMKDTSPSSTWTAFAIRVGSGVDVAPITTTTHDDTTPAALATSLGTQASGQPNAIVLPSSDTSVNKTGTATFNGNSTTTVGTRTFILPDDAPVGTKFCFFLSVTPAASSGTPTTRTSAAKCMTIGIKPKLNVYGGDLSVGRRFATDTSTPDGLKSVINTSLTAKNQDGTRKVFGSWTEYDAYAPGTVTGFGTASGLQGGYATASTDQAQWSKLSFVNVRSTYGTFTNSGALGTIPDIAASVTNGLNVAETLPTTTETIDLNTKPTNGIYKKDTGNLTITGTTLGANRTVVVAAPRGTVTIAGNLQYHPGPYTSPTQIPQLLIIAKNIVIQAPVTTIDAWLIAKTPLTSGASTDPNDVSGRITTCDTPGNLSTTTCNQRLTITGPVMSNQLVLRRTAGFATGDDAPAEIFNLRADAALWIYQQGTGGTPRPVTTDSKDLPVRF